MKKKLLTLAFTLVLLIGLVAAMGMTASAADAPQVTQYYQEIYSSDDLETVLAQIRGATTLVLMADISENSDTADLSYPVISASGNVVLDLNGHNIAVTGDATEYLFKIGGAWSTNFYIVNSQPAKGGVIAFNSKVLGASVIKVDDSNSELHIFDGVNIKLGNNDYYYYSSVSNEAISIDAISTLAIHGATIENYMSFGFGVAFNPGVSFSNTNFIVANGTIIKGKQGSVYFDNAPKVSFGNLTFDYSSHVPSFAPSGTYGVAAYYKPIVSSASLPVFSDCFVSRYTAKYGVAAVDDATLSSVESASAINSVSAGNKLSISRASGSRCLHTNTTVLNFVTYEYGDQGIAHITHCRRCYANYKVGFCTTVSKKDATCTEAGYTATGYFCSCGYKTTTEIPAPGHNYIEYAKSDATCTHPGWKNTMYKCENCPSCLNPNKEEISFSEFSENRIPVLDHDYIDIAQKEETCTEPGFKFNLKYCKRCETYFRSNGDSISETQWDIIYLEPQHKMEIVPKAAATLTTDGNIAHYACSRCDHISSDAEGENAIDSATINRIESVSLSATSLTYNAKVRTPSVTVKDSAGKVLVKDTDYTVTYDEGRRNVGTYNVKVTFMGNYSGSKTLSFKITPMDISKCTVKLSATSYTYKAAVITPTVTITNPNGAKLTKDTHYTVEYSSGRRNVGTYDVTVTLKGNYKGSKTLSFKITPMDISKCTVKLSATSLTYNASVRTPSVTVTNPNGAKLTKDTHYTVTYDEGRRNVGTYNVTVKLKGNYTGTKTLSFKINPMDISKCSVKLSATTLTYNAKVRTPTVSIVNPNGAKLTKDTHYTVTYDEGRRNVGTYNVTVKLKGNYTGTKTLSFKINPMDISKCSVKLSATTLTYNAKVRTPTVSIVNPNGAKLTKDTHYTVTYDEGRRNVGTYNVTVKLKGNYTGTKTLSFTIKPMDISKCTVKLSYTSTTYNGNVRAPSVTVTNANGAKLTKDTHYTVTYASGRKNVGAYKVTVTMKGNYTGTKTLTFKINPPKTTVASLTAGTKSITVAVTKKTTQTTGYQIQYSTSKDFTNAKTKTITSNTTTKATLSSLTSAKTYYVRVRTYKTVNDVKYYSGWSEYKYVKTK